MDAGSDIFLEMWYAPMREESSRVAQFVVPGRRVLGAVFPPFNKVLGPTSVGELDPAGSGRRVLTQKRSISNSLRYTG